MRAAVIATGASLRAEQLAAVAHLPAVVVNEAFRVAPGAVAVYAGDMSWWRKYGSEVSESFPGGRFTFADADADERLELETWSVQPAVTDYGPCSGYGALALALTLKFTDIALLGFDMHGAHYFGRRDDGLRDDQQYENFLPAFDGLAARCKRARISVTNCTPSSRLTSFRRATLAQWLG